MAGGMILAMIAAAGCGGSNRKPVYPVSGKVVINKKGVKGVAVSFHPKGELTNLRAMRSFTTTEEDGTFRLSTYDSDDGAPEGDYVVTLYWPGPLPPGSPIGEVGPDQLGGKYANPQTSTLRAQIRTSRNDLPPFEIQVELEP